MNGKPPAAPAAASDYRNNLTADDLEDDEIEVANSYAHHGAPYDFTAEEIEQAAADYDPRIHRAPVVIDHDWLNDREPYDPQRTGINQGLIERFRNVVKDGVAHLVAQVKDLTPEARALLKSERLSGVSPEWYRTFRPTGRKYPRAIALLGAHPPVGKNLLPPATKLLPAMLFGEGTPEESLRVPIAQPAVRVGGTDEGDPMTGKPKPTGAPEGGTPPATPPAQTPPTAATPPAPTPPEARAPGSTVPPGAGTPDSKEFPPGEGPNPRPTQGREPEPETVLMGEQIKAAIHEAVQPLRDQIDSLKRQLEAADPARGDAAILKFGEELVAEGKITGAERERVVSIAKHLRGQTLRFGDAERDAAEVFMEHERARPDASRVPMGELGMPARPTILRYGDNEAPAPFPIHVAADATAEDKKKLRDFGRWAAKPENKDRYGKRDFGRALTDYESEMADQGVRVG